MLNLKRLDQKLATIRAGNYQPGDFIIADAKDGDMAFGIATPGPKTDAEGQASGGYYPLRTYRDYSGLK